MLFTPGYTTKIIWPLLSPLPAPIRVPSSFTHPTGLHFPSRFLYSCLVPLRDLENFTALQDEGRPMARTLESPRSWAALVVALVVMATAVSEATNPGFMIRISQKGLDYGNWMPPFPPLPPPRGIS